MSKNAISSTLNIPKTHSLMLLTRLVVVDIGVANLTISLLKFG